MTRDPMAPEALALGVLPEWMSEAVWRRLERMGEPRNGDIAQALGLAAPPPPNKRNSPPAKLDPARLRAPGAVRLLSEGRCPKGHDIRGETDLRFSWRWYRTRSHPEIQACCAQCDRERATKHAQASKQVAQ